MPDAFEIRAPGGGAVLASIPSQEEIEEDFRRSNDPDWMTNPTPGASEYHEPSPRRGATQMRDLTHEAIPVSELDDNVAALQDELVERVLTRGASSVVYGDSNSGKTFLALDLGFTIARHMHSWCGGRRVHGGLVLYAATEAPNSIHVRSVAYVQSNECHDEEKLSNLIILPKPIDLFNGTADAEAVISYANACTRTTGAQVELIIGDTLSRMAPGANENAGEDMGMVMRHIDRIRRETGAHFLLIHHCGKDAARGMRGWSGMRAAIDTEIEVTADETTGLHAAEITKQRDIGGKGDRIGFRLQQVKLGIGKWGQPITSCVVVDAEAPAKSERSKRPSEIAGAILELLTSRGAGMKKGDMVNHFAGRYTSGAVYREIKKLTATGKVRDVVGVIGLVRT